MQNLYLDLPVISLNCQKEELRKLFGEPGDRISPFIKNKNLIVTDGIISGVTQDGFSYYTNAKIDSGNSGGLAVSKIAGHLCVVGISTWVSQGEHESLGIIQSIQGIREALTKQL